MATVFVVLAALMYLTAFVSGGVTPETLVLVGVGLVFAMLSGGLSHERRGMAWIAFFVTAIGAIYALAQIWSVGEIPVWWWQTMAAVQGLACLSLFVPLWKAPPRLT